MQSIIVKTEAIVLKSILYGESSKVVSFYTNEFGKLSALAKGVRGKKAKFGSALEPMSHVSLVLYKKDLRDLKLISDCSLLQQFPQTIKELDSLSAALSVLELVFATTNEEKNEQLFSLTLQTLKEINNSTFSSILFLFWFQFRLAENLGFRFQTEHCPSCKKQLQSITGDNNNILEIERGGMLCNNCSRKGKTTMRISSETLASLQVLLTNDVQHIDAFSVSQQSIDEMEHLLNNYFHFHLENYQSPRSLRLYSKVS